MFINEIFLSIQGESTHAGLPFVLVRLAGCNLDCRWCDTPGAKARNGASELSVAEVVKSVEPFGCKLVEISGGEPLLQPEASELASALAASGFSVLVETNGSIGLAELDKRVIKIVDVKCPSSGHSGSFVMDNLALLNPTDEVKFVIADKNDYDFAKGFYEEHLAALGIAVLFSPVDKSLSPRELASWMLADLLPVRLQVQLHKIVWGSEKEGFTEPPEGDPLK